VFALRGELKREAGVNPARSRHCEGDALQNMPLAAGLPGRPDDADEPKSGDLPAPVHQHDLRKIGDEAYISASAPSLREGAFFGSVFRRTDRIDKLWENDHDNIKSKTRIIVTSLISFWFYAAGSSPE
jgi:hypothetical protein